MKIRGISTEGFKSQDIDYWLGDAVAFIGENETNKSHVLHAIDLLFSGFVESESLIDIGKTGDSVLAYARDERKGVRIEALVEHGGKERRVVRTWSRDSGGRVSQWIDQNINASVVGLKDNQRLLFGLLPDASRWNVRELLNASPAEARRRVLALISTGVTAESVCPPKIPDEWLPEPEETGIAWVSRALSLIAQAIAKKKKEQKAVQAEVEALSDAWRPRDDPDQDRLTKARDALHASEKWHRLEIRKQELGHRLNELILQENVVTEEERRKLKDLGAQYVVAQEALDAFNALPPPVEAACPTCGSPRVSFERMEKRQQLSTDAKEYQYLEKEIDRRQKVSAELDQLRAEAALVEAELAENPGLDYEALFAEHDRAQEELTQHKAYMERHEEYREAVFNEGEIKKEIERLEKWQERVLAAQTKVLEHGRPAFEKQLSDVVGKPVRLQLEDARGNAGLSFLVGGVDAAALSDGTVVQFVAGFQVAIAKAVQGYKLLRVDRLESISKGRRSAFIRKLLMAQRAGVVDQLILCGCPDELDAPEGLAVVRC